MSWHSKLWKVIYQTVNNMLKLMIQTDMLKLTTGIPQGSILHPLLFILYMNDIAQVSKLFVFIIYADGTTISTTIEIVVRTTNNVPISNILNNELSMENNWLKVNNL